jgi:hypothetical protein
VRGAAVVSGFSRTAVVRLKGDTTFGVYAIVEPHRSVRL